MPWLVAALTLARLIVIVDAQNENKQVASQFRDVNLSGSLRDRSLDLYEATQSAPGGDWSQPLAQMQRIRTQLQARYPEEVAAGDPAWTAFRVALTRTGRVDWTAASRMREASDILTDAIERDARHREADTTRRLGEGIWVLAGFALGAFVLIAGLGKAEESRERLVSILDVTPDYVCIADPDQRIIYMNRALRLLLGADEAGAPPKLPLTSLYAPGSRERLSGESVTAALRDGSWLGEVTLLDSHGRALPVSQSLHVHRDADGAVRHLSTIMRDIGEQKHVEQSLRAEQERFAAIVAIQQAVAHAELDVERVMSLVAAGAQALVHADGAAVETLEGDAMVLRVAAGILEPHCGLRIALTTPLLADCLANRAVQYCADAATDPRANRAAHQAIGYRSTLLAPMCDGQTVLGVLVLQSIRVDAFTERDAQALQLLAEMVSSTMRRAAEFEAKQALLAERTAATTRLQESQDLFLSSLAAMQEGFMVADWDGTTLMCNKSAERILGMSAEDLVAQDAIPLEWRAITEDGADFPRDDGPARSALRTGNAQHDIVLGLWKPEGAIIWLLFNAAPLFRVGDDAPYAAVLTFSDITERKLIQQEIGRLAAIVESTEDAVIAMTLDGTLVSWNYGAEGLYGFSPAETIGRHCSFLVPPDQDRLIPDVIQRVLRDEEVVPMEVTRSRKDGAMIEVAFTFSPIRNAAGEVIGLGIIGRDITAWKRTEQALRLSEARLNLAQQIAGIGNWEYDVETGVMHWSKEMFQLLEFDPEAGTPSYEAMMRRYHPDDRPLHDRSVQAAISDGVSYEFDVRVLSRDENLRWMHTIGHCLCDEDARVVQLHGTLMEVTERKIAEQRIHDDAVALELQKQELVKVNAQLESLAATDMLTSLSNRRAFQLRLDDEMQRADRYGTPLSLVMLDVDNFKLYNDAFGHPAGDGVLRQVARILQDTTRDFDLAARYGGEEFVVIFPHTDGASALTIAERCRFAIETAVWELRDVTASFGVATLTPGMSADALIALADAAMYRSKAGGRNRVTRGGALEADMDSLREALPR